MIYILFRQYYYSISCNLPSNVSIYCILYYKLGELQRQKSLTGKLRPICIVNLQVTGVYVQTWKSWRSCWSRIIENSGDCGIFK